jgi:hypothetical protein
MHKIRMHEHIADDLEIIKITGLEEIQGKHFIWYEA